MHIVLLSGGSGRRLWPLSNDARAKQFLRVLPKEDGTKESMLQKVWGQLSKYGLQEHVYIATRESQKETIFHQLGQEIPLILEPERRDTFPTISLAVAYLHSIQSVKSDETICFMPVDAFVEEHFYNLLKSLPEVLRESDAQFALIGIEPTYPSEKYGYIVPDHTLPGANYLWTKQFVEKPDSKRAGNLIEQGAAWNGGVFAATMGSLTKIISSRGVSQNYNELILRYGTLKEISFDYEVIEKSNRVVYVPYTGNWKDLGTWNTLSEEMGSPIYGRGILSADTFNTHIVNELKFPVAVIGVSDAIVAVSSDGVLVSKKSESHQVKDVLSEIVLPPMYEEKQWGWTRVLDYSMSGEEQGYITQRIGIFAGQTLDFPPNWKQTKVWTILSGKGTTKLLPEDQPIQAIPFVSGTTITIAKGVTHAFVSDTDVEIIEILLD